LPQLPQLSGSFAVSAQVAPHAMPFGHVKPHAPPTHVAVPPGGAVHVAPQAPQFAGSLGSVTQ
jgi:hypothetical protein